MNTRTLYRIVPFVLAFAGFVRAADQPNVVFLVSDDQRWTDYGFMGHAHIDTPALDRFAHQSLTFSRGYVPDSLCRPSLATMVSGLYPHQHGITGNDPSLPDGVNTNQARRDAKHPQHAVFQRYCAMLNEHPHLPGILSRHGYLSLQTGKWWEGNPKDYGFTHAMTHGDRTRGGRHGDAGLAIGRNGMRPIWDFLDEAKAKGKPFFLWYAPFLPHTPHDPPDRLYQKYLTRTSVPMQAKYWAMCEWFDETCGELLTQLDERGLSDNTIVVYVCDNGWNQPFGPYKNIGHGGGGARAKRSPYDGGVRTPIMVRFPGKLRPGIDNRTLVSSIDLLPTVLAACGIDAPADLPGVNLLDADARAKRDTIFGEILEHDVADLDDPAKSLRYRWVIDGRWKLIVPHAPIVPDEPVELFDLFTDEMELRNLAEQHPDKVAALRQQLDAWWKP